MREAQISLAFKKWAVVSFGALWLLATVVEYFVELHGLELVKQEAYGVLSYGTAEAASGPPPMILLVLVALFIAAVMLAWKRKWWWLLVGTVVMTIGSAIPFDIGSEAVTNAFELFLLVMLMWTGIHFSKQAASQK